MSDDFSAECRSKTLKDKKTITNILYYSLYSQPLNEIHYPDLQSSLNVFVENDWVRSELDSLLAYLEEKTEVMEEPLDLGFESGLSLIPVIKFSPALDIGLPKTVML